jgi:DNA-binding protein HU-beta
MNKPEMVNLIADEAQITKKAATLALETLVDAVKKSLKSNSGKIKISELGTFRVLELKARAGVNPRTGKKMTIPAMRVPRFTPAKALKEVVSGKRN